MDSICPDFRDRVYCLGYQGDKEAVEKWNISARGKEDSADD